MAVGSPSISMKGRALRLEPARADDRWRAGDGRRALSRVAPPVLAASLLVHAAMIVAVLMWVRHAPPPAPAPIPVELVQEPTPPATAPSKAAASKPAPPAPAPTKVVEPAKPAPTKPEPPKPSAAEQAAAAQRAALERELDALKAEQQALRQSPAAKAAAEKAEKEAQAQAARDASRAALLDSIQGLALPATAADGEIAVDYKTLVFSQLAKAKDGFPPGTVAGVAGVTFAVGADGVLSALRVVISSGVKSLDDEAEAIVRRASPFPPPPEGAQRAFSVNVSFAVPKP